MKNIITVEGFAARDKDGKLYIYTEKPYKAGEGWISDNISADYLFRISDKEASKFSDVKWQNKEPIKITLKIYPNVE